MEGKRALDLVAPLSELRSETPSTSRNSLAILHREEGQCEDWVLDGPASGGKGSKDRN